MNANQPRYNHDEMARRGEEHFERGIRHQIEDQDPRQFVVIDIESGDFEVDADELAASDRLLARHPDAQMWLRRVGSPFARRLGRASYPVRKSTLKDQDDDSDYAAMTPEERVGIMWQLALDAWAFKGEPVAEPGLSRHIVRVHRRRG